MLENKGQRSVAFDLNQGHSIKPGTLQERLELMLSSANKLEMFARRVRKNWTAWGDEIDCMDIHKAIQDHVDASEAYEKVKI